MTIFLHSEFKSTIYLFINKTLAIASGYILHTHRRRAKNTTHYSNTCLVISYITDYTKADYITPEFPRRHSARCRLPSRKGGILRPGYVRIYVQNPGCLDSDPNTFPSCYASYVRRH